MSGIPKINTQGTSGVNSGSSGSSDNFASADTKNQNSTNLTELEGLRNNLTERTTANNTTPQNADNRTQSHQASGELKNASSVEAIKRLVQAINTMVQKVDQFMNTSPQGQTDGNSTKPQPQQTTQKVQGTQGGSVDGFNQNSFLFNQKPDTRNNP